MPIGSSPAALSGETHVEVNASEDALQSVDLGERDKTPKGEKDGERDQDREREPKGDADRNGAERDGEEADPRRDSEDDEGYSPDRARLRAARSDAKRAKTRSGRLEREMVRLSVEVDGLKTLATKGLEATARDKKAEAQTRYKEAWTRRTKAFDEGKSDDWNRAEADLKTAERDFAAASTEEAAAREQGTKTGRTTVLDDWLNDPANSWFDPDGNDADSEFARKVSKDVARDGIPINSVAHFEEVTRRIKKARPQLYKDDGGEEQDDRSARRNGGDRDRDRGPSGVVGGRRDQGDGGEPDYTRNTKVPKELVRNYAAVGFDVTDPKVKERIIKKYNEHMRSRTGGVNVG